MARSKAVSFKLSAKPLVQRAEKAFEEANDDLKEMIVGEIISPVWDWTGTTERENGETVGSPRDIVDQGELLDGYQEPQMQGKRTCVHVFTAPHTVPIHNGAQLANGGVIQARPFTERPLENFPELFAKRFRDG